MILDLTSDQRLIRDEARRFLAERASSQALRRTLESGDPHDADLWRMASGELGWCAIAIPEEYGGLGLGQIEQCLLMEACGERLASMPLWSSACLTAPVLLACASHAARQDLLPKIATGAMAVSVALPLDGEGEPLSRLAVAATASRDGYVLAGTLAQVIDLPVADVMLVPARLDSGHALFALDRSFLSACKRLETLDATRPVGTLVLDHLDVPSSARIDTGGLLASGFSRALRHGNLGLAAEQVGTAQGALDLTCAYIAGRVQFGRSIASFQVVKHRCAILAIDIAEARSLVHGAAVSLDRGAADAALEVAGARALATQVQFAAAREAIQLHGGVGCTWEYDPHLYFRRAQASATLLGRADRHFAQIADHLLAHGMAA